MPKIFMSTSPFGEIDSEPVRLLKATGWGVEDHRIHPKLHNIEGIFISE
jgi:hypothetical protein